MKPGFPVENGGHAGRRREARLDRTPSLKDRRPIGGPTTAPAPWITGGKKKAGEEAHGRGRPAQGGQAGGCPRSTERPPFAGNKSAFYATLICAGQGVAPRKSGCEAYPPNERIKSLLFPAANPPLRVSVRAGGVTGCALSCPPGHFQAHLKIILIRGQPARLPQAGAYQANVPSARELFRVKALEPNTWRFERGRGQFKNDAPPCPWSGN